MSAWISELLVTCWSVNSTIGPEWSCLEVENFEESHEEQLYSKVDDEQHGISVRVEEDDKDNHVCALCNSSSKTRIEMPNIPFPSSVDVSLEERDLIH